MTYVNDTTFRRRSLRTATLVVLTAVVAALGAAAATASDAAAAPELSVEAHNFPTNFSPGEPGRYLVRVTNVGDSPTAGPVSATVTMPAGVQVTAAGDQAGQWSCTATLPAPSVSCEFVGGFLGPDLAPGASAVDFELTIDVPAQGGDAISIDLEASGGGAPPAYGTQLAPVSATPAGFGPRSGSLSGDAFDAAGGLYTQAAGHPYEVESRIELNTLADSNGYRIPHSNVKDLQVDAPPGLVGNPQRIPRCAGPELNSSTSGRYTDCPIDSQVGVLDLRFGQFTFGNGTRYRVPLYNMVPVRGEPAAFAGVLTGVTVRLVATLQPDGNYALRVKASNINQTLGLVESAVSLWGTPADSRHDGDRGAVVICQPSSGCFGFGGGLPYSAPRAAFLTNPSDCGHGPFTLRARARSWQDPTVWRTTSAETASGVTGCDALRFEPTVDIAPTTTVPDSPTGLSVDMKFPQTTNPDALDTPPLKRATVTLPEGMSISPGAADGLQACTDEQLGLRSDAPLACPPASKIGSVEVRTPVLDEVLEGGVYVRRQASDDPQSGEMFRLAMVVESAERGILVKLPGSVRVDSRTGRIVAEFDNNPQLPVSELSLELKGGTRAPLATPPTCGVKTVTSSLTAWSGHTAEISRPVVFPCPGVAGFSPSLDGGTLAPLAGRFSPLSVRIERSDREEYIDGVEIDLPAGLLARLRGVPLCPDAQMNAGSCGADSRVGSAAVGAGPGPAPFYLKGQPVYLGGPYKGAPYSLSVAVRAVAGPFDLGMVVVRQALHVDPDDAHVRVVSDALPTIVKGVPLRLRSIDVEVDRPGFVINPTSCAAKRIQATFRSEQGSAASQSSPFRATDCSAPAFKPKLGMRLVGKKQMRSGGHPALRAVVTQAGGQANIAKARVTLPRNVVLDATNSADPKLLCGYDASLKADCPKSTIIGKASLSTPILNRKLSGPVHLVQGIRFENGNRIRGLPTLLVKLRGEVAINLRSKTAVDSRDRLVSIFPSVPDAAVSKFSLQVNGGPKGILVVTETRQGRIDLCDQKQTALVKTDGHNGKRADYPVRVKTPCATRKRR